MGTGYEIGGNKKPKKKARTELYYVLIKWKNNPTPKKFYVKSTAPHNIELYLKRRLHLWENAHLARTATKKIEHYYHPDHYQMAADQHRLTKEQYYSICFKPPKTYLLCIIHTTSYKRRTGDYKFKGAIIKNLNEVLNYWNKDVLRIDIREGKTLVNSFDKRGFKYPIE